MRSGFRNKGLLENVNEPKLISRQGNHIIRLLYKYFIQYYRTPHRNCCWALVVNFIIIMCVNADPVHCLGELNH